MEISEETAQCLILASVCFCMVAYLIELGGVSDPWFCGGVALFVYGWYRLEKQS